MEMKSYAKWVADLMKADGVKPDQVSPELSLAYFEEVGRRIVKIQSICLTRSGASGIVAGLVFRAAPVA